jgi:hypothetical protein
MGTSLCVLLHVRCDASTRTNSLPSCQLYVGHEGAHASLIVATGDRQIVRWRTAEFDLAVVPFDVEIAARLPWAPGCAGVAMMTPVAHRLIDERARHVPWGRRSQSRGEARLS